MAHMLSKGKTLAWKNITGSDVKTNQPVVVGDTLTIAETNILNGNSGSLNLEGVYFMPKAAEGLAQGKKVYWDADGNPQGGVAGTGALTLVSTDNLYAGIVYESALTDSATVAVKINA